MNFRITGDQNNSELYYYIDDKPVSESEYFKKLHNYSAGEKVKSLVDATQDEWDTSSRRLLVENLIKLEQDSKTEISGKSDGLHADYYTLPKNATQLQDLISHRNMNAQIGEIFRECYRYGLASHSDELRGINKIFFYAKAEKERLERLYAE